MSNNIKPVQTTSNYPVIDQFFAAQIAANESSAAHPDSDSIKRGFRLAFNG